MLPFQRYLGWSVQSRPSAVEYTSPDGTQAVVLRYLHSERDGMALPMLHLKGRDPKATYTLTPLDPAKYTGPARASEALLMGTGVPLQRTGDYDATALVLERRPDAINTRAARAGPRL